MAQRTNWAYELAKNGRVPETQEGMAEMAQQMEDMGLKGMYNPMNMYPGSPFTPSWMPTREEVITKAKYASEAVLEDWNRLRRIAERHSDVLEKRWMKRTKKKQKDLLLQAWPEMSATHRPDYQAYFAENTGRRCEGLSKFQEAYKWPYINQQDLSSRSLIVFITSRGQNPPSAFAHADLDATHLGTVGHMIPEPAFLDGHTMFMNGDNAEEYAKLVAWEDDGDALELFASGRQFSPGEGLKVLELQQKVYPFLVKCCELILHDLVENGTLFDDSTAEETTPQIPAGAQTTSRTLTNTEASILPSLASISAEAPYRLPANIDLERLRGILAARLSAAEDHLWSMREDPGYFSATIMDWSEHRNDALLDTRGNPHPTGPHTLDFWERVIRNAVSDAYSGFETWSLLHRQVNALVKLKEKYKDEILYEKQLPKEYLVQILQFQKILLISCETPLHHLKNIQSSPPLRSRYTRDPQMPGTINMLIKPIRENDPHFHRPWGLLLILWDEKQRKLFGLPNVIDAFEQIMQDPVEKRNLSPYMADLFSDLAILSRALREIEIYQPWAATFEEEAKKYRKETLKVMEEATFQLNYMRHMDMVLKNIVPLAMPGDGKFRYPIDKKRTKENTEVIRRAESNLDLFWDRFDANWKRLSGKKIEYCMGDHKPRHRGQKIERTPPWVEPVKEQTEKIPVGIQWMDSKEEKSPTTPKKTKQKTKGQQKSVAEPAPPTEETGAQIDAQPAFKVDKASLKVFNMLFFSPGQVGVPGEIPWIDFLRAMASTGFAAQKLYGSIWQFTPTNLDVERSIQFHEPHPAVKIQFSVARRMGRRLTRAYGWHGGMFQLA